MDDDGSISLVSIPDSDISFHTLIDDVETTTTKPTYNQQLYACSLFVNHWVDGTIKEDKDLRSAKKEYVEGLKEKPTESPTIIFEKKTSQDNTKLSKHGSKVEMISISSRSTGRSRSPIKSNMYDESQNRKNANCSADLEKKKQDENHNNLVGITERRKSVLIIQIKAATATAARRKTICIDDPRSITPSIHNSSGIDNFKTVHPALPTSSNGTVKSGGHRLATTSSNHTVTSATVQSGKNKLNGEHNGKNKLKAQRNKDEHKERTSKDDSKHSSHREAQRPSKLYEEEIASLKKRILEQDQVIKERQRWVTERDSVIEERNQKTKELDEKIKSQEIMIRNVTHERDEARRSANATALILSEYEANCKANHRENPKPRKPKTTRRQKMLQPSSSPEMVLSPNHLNGIQNENHRILPETLIRNIDQMKGNSPPLFPTATTIPSIFPQNF